MKKRHMILMVVLVCAVFVMTSCFLDKTDKKEELTDENIWEMEQVEVETTRTEDDKDVEVFPEPSAEVEAVIGEEDVFDSEVFVNVDEENTDSIATSTRKPDSKPTTESKPEATPSQTIDSEQGDNSDSDEENNDFDSNAGEEDIFN
ncbi:MAG: hypothetical protein IKM38_03955 [Christensenellaceae bacterium]|nr:hypothetical protein [Christensenellaceae bacterium]